MLLDLKILLNAENIAKYESNAKPSRGYICVYSMLKKDDAAV